MADIDLGELVGSPIILEQRFMFLNNGWMTGADEIIRLSWHYYYDGQYVWDTPVEPNPEVDEFFSTAAACNILDTKFTEKCIWLPDSYLDKIDTSMCTALDTLQPMIQLTENGYDYETIIQQLYRIDYPNITVEEAMQKARNNEPVRFTGRQKRSFFLTNNLLSEYKAHVLPDFKITPYFMGTFSLDETSDTNTADTESSTANTTPGELVTIHSKDVSKLLDVEIIKRGNGLRSDIHFEHTLNAQGSYQATNNKIYLPHAKENDVYMAKYKPKAPKISYTPPSGEFLKLVMDRDVTDIRCVLTDNIYYVRVEVDISGDTPKITLPEITLGELSNPEKNGLYAFWRYNNYDEYKKIYLTKYYPDGTKFRPIFSKEYLEDWGLPSDYTDNSYYVTLGITPYYGNWSNVEYIDFSEIKQFVQEHPGIPLYVQRKPNTTSSSWTRYMDIEFPGMKPDETSKYYMSDTNNYYYDADDVYYYYADQHPRLAKAYGIPAEE